MRSTIRHFSDATSGIIEREDVSWKIKKKLPCPTCHRILVLHSRSLMQHLSLSNVRSRIPSSWICLVIIAVIILTDITLSECSLCILLERCVLFFLLNSINVRFCCSSNAKVSNCKKRKFEKPIRFLCKII